MGVARGAGRASEGAGPRGPGSRDPAGVPERTATGGGVSIRIRRVRAGEWEALTKLALRSKSYWGYDEAFMARCRDVLTVDEEYLRTNRVFVAEMGGALAGFGSLAPRGPDLELDLLFVEPDRIGDGVGRALLDHALAAAASAGHRRLVVESDPNAEAFYLRCGGRRIGTVASTVEAGRELPLLEFRL